MLEQVAVARVYYSMGILDLPSDSILMVFNAFISLDNVHKKNLHVNAIVTVVFSSQKYSFFSASLDFSSFLLHHESDLIASRSVNHLH
jgi:hypothetical protein